MELLLSIYTNQFLVFLLVLTRVSGLVTSAPLWSSSAIPIRIRVFVAVGIALILTPRWWNTPIDDPGNVVHLAILMSCEFAIGLALGLAVTICFAGMQLAGQVMGQMTGMSLADVASPDFDASVPVFSQFLHMLMLAVFVTTGGHQQILHTFIRMFERMPPGHTQLDMPLLEALNTITSYSFVLGLQLAAPIMLTLLLTILVMGLISRTMPQFNVLAVGFSVNSMVMLGALLLSLGVLTRLFALHSLEAIQMMGPLLGTSPP